MKKAFVLAETDTAARELCAGARTMSDKVVLCMVGASAVVGVADKCIHVNVPANNIVDDAYLTVNASFATENAQIVLAEAGSLPCLSLVGRLAAANGTAVITNATAFDDTTATSMYFGGVGTRTAKPIGNLAMYTVGKGIFDNATASGTDIIEEVAFQAPSVAAVRICSEALPKSDVDLTAANVVVACGRGFSTEEDLQIARNLASKVGAELGCTRPLAEAVNWFPREAYIGVSGAVIKPKVYFALGISGQMQHMVGCNGSGTVIAINKDKNAPIFKQCDFGFVGDLKAIVPAITSAL